MHHVAPQAVGEALAGLLGDPVRANDLRAAGLANAASYPWSVLEDAAVEMVRPFASPWTLAARTSIDAIAGGD